MPASISQKTRFFIITGLIILSVAVHLIPFALYGKHPLGYDTGFYRRYLIEPALSFPNPPTAGLGNDAFLTRFSLHTLRFTGLSPDIILYGGYIVVWAAVVAVFFFLVESFFGVKTALLASLFFIFSPIQYINYWSMLWKNTLAALFLFLAFLAINKKSWLLIPLTVAISSTHQTTSIIYILTLAVYFLFNFRSANKREFLKLAGALGYALIIFLFLHLDFYKNFINPPVAAFVKLLLYVKISAPLFLLAVFGVKDFIFWQKKSILAAFGIASIAFPLFQLPFHERIIIFTDIFLIIIGAIGLKNLRESFASKKTFLWKAGVCVVAASSVGWYLGNFKNQVENFTPMISGQELAVVQNLKQHIPPEAAILTSNELAPWVHGWTLNKVIAPGLMERYYNHSDWIDFWNSSSGAQKIDFLSVFPKPLFIVINPEQEKYFVPQLPCVKNISAFVFHYQCQN